MIVSEKPPLRMGLVGLGKIARDQHVPAIRADARFALAATVDPAVDLSGQPAPAFPDLPAFRDLEALLAARRAGAVAVDAVALCTPPAVRCALAAQALAAGLHVLLEKPPALTAAQARPLADLARQQGRSLFAAWHSREGGAVEAATRWLAGQVAAGQAIRAVRVVWRESIDRWHPGQDWLLAEGGFGVFDPAINAFSILTRILPAPLTVEGATLGVPANRAAPAEAQVRMRCAGAPVICDLSILEHTAQHWDIVVQTTDGELALTDGGAGWRIDGQAQAVAPAAEYPRIYHRFAELVAGGASELDLAPLVLVDEALRLGERRSLPPFHFAVAPV